jgi:hypothetical protein
VKAVPGVEVRELGWGREWDVGEIRYLIPDRNVSDQHVSEVEAGGTGLNANCPKGE